MRPAVGDDVVHRQQQHVVVRRQPHQPRRGPAARCARSKGAPASSADQPAQLVLARPPRQRRRSCSAQPGTGSPRRGDALRPARHPPRRNVVRSASWRRRSRPAPRASAPRSSAPAGAGRIGMLYGRPRLQLSRNHSRCCANDSGSVPVAIHAPRSRPAAPRRRGRRAPARRAPPASGASNSVAQRQLHAERLPHAARPPGRQQRVPAQLEEVVAAAHPLARPAPPPRSPPAPPPPAPRGASYPRAADRSPSGAGSARGRPCRSASAAARRARTKRRRHHVLRQALAQVRAQRLRGRPASPPAPRRRPAALARRVLARQHHRLAHRRVLARARASISPSSIRKPRTFTWWSMRPRNSSVAVAPASAPGRRCGTAARPARPRTDRGRTARRSAPAGPGSRAPRRRRRCTARRHADRHRLASAASST